jgi:D-cysteine desulfhydrase family pyridoxal phosphate-dependent enzyme
MAATITTLTTEVELRAAIGRLPRAQLGNYPTPLDDAPRFSAALGGPRILIKRDDLTGLALGGNKTRKLEFNFGEAIALGADIVVATAAAQSNHCRQTAAAAAKLGLPCHLLLRGGHNDQWPPQGNLLLDHILGAKVRLVQGDDARRMPEVVAAYMDELRAQGHRPYQAINRLEADRLGAVAYMDAFLELYGQLRERGIDACKVYLASVGGTGGGLALAAKIVAPQVKIVAFTPMDVTAVRLPRLLDEANSAAELLGIPDRLTAGDVEMYDNQIGPGYELLSPEAVEALQLLARTEGVLLDPIYTSKAVAGLIDHVRRGVLRPDETVVYLHTGGVPALFAYNAELADAMRSEL